MQKILAVIKLIHQQDLSNNRIFIKDLFLEGYLFLLVIISYFYYLQSLKHRISLVGN